MKKAALPDAALKAYPEWPFQRITVNIVALLQDDEWIATILEMDLQAVGKTHEEAISAVQEMFVHQVAFAVQKRQPSLLFKQAEPFYWELFHEHRRLLLSSMVTGERPARDDIRVDTLPIDQGMIGQHLQRNHKPYQRRHAA